MDRYKWIFSAGMVRSGSTLQYQIAERLLEVAGVGKSLGFVDNEAEFIELTEKQSDASTPFLVKVHNCSPLMQSLIDEETTCVLYTYRDLRDVVVSMEKAFSQSPEVVVRDWLIGCREDEARWRSGSACFVWPFEKCNDVLGQVRAMARFLELKINDKVCIQIADSLSVASQQKKIDQVDNTLVEHLGDKLLHSRHINSVPNGDWLRVLDGELRWKAEYDHAEWLNGKGYPLVFRDSTDALELQGIPVNPRIALRWPYGSWPAPRDSLMPSGEPWPKISVVTASYNQGRFLEECILSLIGQQYPNLEYILVDNESNDSTSETLKKYSKFIDVCIVEPDAGQSNAINKGLHRATGDILTWLNCDDRLAPEALHAVALAFVNNKVDLVAGICQLMDVGGEIYDGHMCSAGEGDLVIEEILDYKNYWYKGRYFYQPECFFTRDVWERSGGCLNESIHINLDYDMWIRFAINGAKLKVIGTPICQFRIHDGQKTFDTSRMCREANEIVAKYRNQLELEASPEGIAFKASRLKILFINNFGFFAGAGIAHGRMLDSMCMGGCDVLFMQYSDHASSKKVLKSPRGLLREISKFAPDWVVVGNLHGCALPISLLREITAKYATFIVLHDFWMLTGGCAYPGNSFGYLGKCGDSCTCDFDNYPSPGRELLQIHHEEKLAIFTNESLVSLGACSAWAYERATEWSDGLNCRYKKPPVYRLRIGVDTSCFRPRPSGACRMKLNLPLDKFIILTSSMSLDDGRKRLDELLALVDGFKDKKDILVLGIGQPLNSEIAKALEGVWVNVGRIDDPRVMAAYYSASDVHVQMSREETFGQTFIEAAACGTPSIGFATTGITSAISHMVSGLLCDPEKPDSLKAAITLLYSDRNLLRGIGQTATIWLNSEYSIERSYYDFFKAFEQDCVRLNRMSLLPKIAIMPSVPTRAKNIVLVTSIKRHKLIRGIYRFFRSQKHKK